MGLQGSSIPLDCGGVVTTVVCPNAYSHSRLMQALSNIVPEAAGDVAHCDGRGNTSARPSDAEVAVAILRELAERDDDAAGVGP